MKKVQKNAENEKLRNDGSPFKISLMKNRMPHREFNKLDEVIKKREIHAKEPYDTKDKFFMSQNKKVQKNIKFSDRNYKQQRMQLNKMIVQGGPRKKLSMSKITSKIMKSPYHNTGDQQPFLTDLIVSNGINSTISNHIEEAADG